ncbi:MAG TPA: carbohydrate kinase family protein [Anaerolineae bacterium]|nr:carbohydrate kinase family protein [Anaerolineae bacterium]
MSVVLTGSIAYDYIMSFPGYFKDHILPDKLHQISVSFLVDSMKRQRGGIAPNIAYSLALLGERPKIMATVGEDFEEYRRWLELHYIDTSAIIEIPDEFTASFFVSTDKAQNQIASFYTGAMAHAHLVSFKDHVNGGIELAVISPNDPHAMVQYVAECKELGIPYIYDASQQIVRVSDTDLVEGCTGSKMIILNDYELEMLKNKTGWTSAQVAASTETLIVTYGEKGSRIIHGDEVIDIPIAKPRKVGEPTGTGDAYRSGIIKGVMHNYSWEFTGRLGALAATYALEENGAQNHRYSLEEFAERFYEEFGNWDELEKLVSH